MKPALFLILPCIACSSVGPPRPRPAPPPEPAAAVAPAPAPRTDGMAPPPFTAAEMRAGTPNGRTVVLEETSPDTGDKTLRIIRYDNVNATGADMLVTLTDAQAAAKEGQITAAIAWNQQERQVTRPANATRIERVRITVPAGTFDAQLYTVDELRDDGLRRVMKDWYAREVPGIPIKSWMTLDGRVVHDAVLVENRTR